MCTTPMKNDFNELVRRSIRKDFANANFKRNAPAPIVPHPKNTKRVLELNEKCAYYRFRKYFVGRLVRIISKAISGVWVEFVRDGDRESLNNAAGWTENKRRYLLEGAKFDE